MVVLIIAIGVMLALAWLSLETLSAARAYIAGESAWAKAEKRAVASLTRYVRTRNEDDYERFLTQLQVPLGDLRARRELDSPAPDMKVVREGLITGGVHPDDVDRVAGFYRRFGHVAEAGQDIGVWAAADSLVLRLLEQGQRIRGLIDSGLTDEGALSAALDEVHELEHELTALQVTFARAMGDAARDAHRMLLWSAGGAALFLLIASARIVRRAARLARASEDAIRHAEEKKRTVLETIEDGFYEMDLDGAVTSANPAFHRVLGRPPDEVLEHHIRQVLDPLSAPRLLDALAFVRRTGAPARAVTAAVLRPDGSRRTVEASATLLHDRDGHPIGFCGVVRDVTERLEQEEALRRSEAEYRAIVEHASYGIYRSTPDGQLLAVNPALVGMLGYDSEAELLAVPLAEGVYARNDERAELIRAHADSDTVSDVEVEWKRRDGAPLLVRLNGRRIRDQDGFNGFEMFVEDVTQSRALEQQLRQAQKMQAVGQLTGGIAHDFNNLLTIIASTADLLAEDLPRDDERARADLDELRRAARRGAEMVRKLLAFSRKGHLEFTGVDLGEMARETVAMLRRMLPAHIEIELAAPAKGPVCRADRGALEQILLNLATNARDAMPEGGTLRIETGISRLDAEYVHVLGDGRPGDYGTLFVTDDGCGMDAATRERAFEPFFTTKPPGSGTGLGMAMIYGLVRQHDGFVELESEPGCGTSVRVHLPLTDSARAAPAGQPAATRPGGTETILLVEDEPAILGTGRRILERHGYSVITAADGQEALDRIVHEGLEPDLILTDVVMPRMGGRALYTAVRGAGRTTRFLFTSGYTEREVGGILDPGLPLVAKPWTVGSLVTRVREVLDGPAPCLPASGADAKESADSAALPGEPAATATRAT